ncbi:MAG: biotin/lipoyl-binding protein, partial [Planctomycetales bacterium]|nr:biotin/lipoyl-binding protein [Planctomycetales bacterium]
VKVYGLAACCWRIVVSIGLLIGASALLAGAGFVVALVAGAMWMASPLRGVWKYATGDNNLGSPNWSWCLSVTTIAIVTISASLRWIPEPGGIRAPGVVAYEDQQSVRAPHDGFVKHVLVADGQRVEAGQLLIELENRELRCEVGELNAQIEQSVLRGRTLQHRNEIAAYQAECDYRASLSQRHEELCRQLADSRICAVRAGIVVRRDLDALQGTYVSEGAVLLVLGDERDKEINIAIAQDDVPYFHSHVSASVLAFLPGSPVGGIPCQLEHVDPRAQMELSAPALGANNGGPLAVKPKAQSKRHSTGGEEWELVEPHFVGRVKVPHDQSGLLRAGQLATVTLRGRQRCLGEFLYRGVYQWFRTKLDTARQQ